MDKAYRSSLAVKIGRALLLRCPRCGSGGIVRHWMRMADRCPRCALALERGEDHDFWLGAYAINLVVAEGFTVVVSFFVLWKTWPASRLAQWTAITMAVVMPMLFYPFSRTLWLGFDLHFRPREAGDDGSSRP